MLSDSQISMRSPHQCKSKEGQRPRRLFFIQFPAAVRMTAVSVVMESFISQLTHSSARHGSRSLFVCLFMP